MKQSVITSELLKCRVNECVPKRIKQIIQVNQYFEKYIMLFIIIYNILSSILINFFH